MAFQIKLKKSELESLNLLWSQLPNVHAQTKEERCLKNVIDLISIKFLVKEAKLKVANKSKETKLKIEYYEAFFLEEFIRTNHTHLQNEYDQFTVIKIANHLNQLLA